MTKVAGQNSLRELDIATALDNLRIKLKDFTTDIHEDMANLGSVTRPYDIALHDKWQAQYHILNDLENRVSAVHTMFDKGTKDIA